MDDNNNLILLIYQYLCLTFSKLTTKNKKSKQIHFLFPNQSEFMVFNLFIFLPNKIKLSPILTINSIIINLTNTLLI